MNLTVRKARAIATTKMTSGRKSDTIGADVVPTCPRRSALEGSVKRIPSILHVFATSFVFAVNYVRNAANYP